MLPQATPPLATPSNLRRDGATTRTTIGLIWDFAGSAPVRFEIRERRPANGGGFGDGENVPGDRRTALRTGLLANTTYEFRIRAIYLVNGVEYGSAWIISNSQFTTQR